MRPQDFVDLVGVPGFVTKLDSRWQPRRQQIETRAEQWSVLAQEGWQLEEQCSELRAERRHRFDEVTEGLVNVCELREVSDAPRYFDRETKLVRYAACPAGDHVEL